MNLANAFLGQQLAALFETNTTLTFLQLSNCKLTSQVLGTLANLIFDLFLQDAAPLLKAVSQGRNLRKLHLSNNSLTTLEGLHLDRTDKLVELLLNGNTLLGDAAARQIAAGLALNRSLVTLNLSRCGVSMILLLLFYC